VNLYHNISTVSNYVGNIGYNSSTANNSDNWYFPTLISASNANGGFDVNAFAITNSYVFKP